MAGYAAGGRWYSYVRAFPAAAAALEEALAFTEMGALAQAARLVPELPEGRAGRSRRRAAD